MRRETNIFSLYDTATSRLHFHLSRFAQIRKGVFIAGQNEERKEKDARQETHAASNLRRTAQGQRRCSVCWG